MNPLPSPHSRPTVLLPPGQARRLRQLQAGTWSSAEVLGELAGRGLEPGLLAAVDTMDRAYRQRLSRLLATGPDSGAAPAAKALPGAAGEPAVTVSKTQNAN